MDREQNKTIKILEFVNLYEPIKDPPALLASVILSIALLEVIVALPALSIPNAPAVSLHILIVLVGASVGMVSYFAGNLWDSMVFDPLYGRWVKEGIVSTGRWSATSTRPLHLFPAGDELSESREAAVKTIFPSHHTGKGIYGQCAKIVQQTGEWEKVQRPLISSKFIRSLILPSALAAVLSLFGGLGFWLYQWPVNPGGLFSLGVVLFIFTLSLFIPYFHLRVDHMIRLYSTATELSRAEKKSPPEPTR
jgi:hypothetical protein